MRKHLALLCATLLVAIQTSAQLFNYLDTQDGLRSRRFISIEKDSKGYMWFLTNEGADRYNGKQYKHYKLIDGEQNIQQFSHLNTLQIDKQGYIWVLGKDGRMFKYNSDFDLFQLKFKFSDTIKSNKRLPLTITKIDDKDNLWLCTKKAQYIYEIQTGLFFQLDSPIQEEITSLIQADDKHY